MKRILLLVILFSINYSCFAQWTALSSVVDSTNIFNDLFFLNGMRGFAVGGNSNATKEAVMIKTSDGGQSWDSVHTGLNGHINGIWFLNDSTGLICGGETETKILRTTDQGNSWDTVYSCSLPPDDCWFEQLFFVNEQVGYCSYYDYDIVKLLKTIDGGITWNEVGPAFGEGYMNDIYFPSEDSGVVAFFDINDYDTYIMVTGNGGNSWHTVLSNGDLALGYRSVVALDNETIVAAGAYAAAITSDGGNSWVEYPFPFVNLGPFPNDMVFVSATEGWIAGRFILKTNDGGFTWTVEDSTIDNYGVELNTLKFPSADTGYAAGNYGLILKYVNTSTVTNVEIITSPNLLVYPNPASSFINIKHPYQEVELNISNSMGEIILKREVMKEESFVDVSSFPPGIYLIKLVSMNEVAIHKFVKQ